MWATGRESRSDIIDRYRPEDKAEERHDPAFWAELRERIEAAARSAS